MVQLAKKLDTPQQETSRYSRSGAKPFDSSHEKSQENI